jgi:hypothetical protein
LLALAGAGEAAGEDGVERRLRSAATPEEGTGPEGRFRLMPLSCTKELGVERRLTSAATPEEGTGREERFPGYPACLHLGAGGNKQRGRLRGWVPGLGVAGRGRIAEHCAILHLGMSPSGRVLSGIVLPADP